MGERFLGLAAIVALLCIAYQASRQTTSSWRSPSAEAQVSGSEAHRPKFVPASEAVVGRPHDGIRALPLKGRQRRRTYLEAGRD
jgi:hypothetical protein